MDTCTIESGLLRKKPCGHSAVARCLNCEQPLCAQHAVAQLTEAGHKSGKFMCQECVAALKDHAKSMAAVARTQEERKLASLAAAAKSQMAEPPAPAAAKMPAAHTPPVPAPDAAVKQPEESGALEFTPKDGKLEYTPKKD
jgi:hypothetical protein